MNLTLVTDNQSGKYRAPLVRSPALPLPPWAPKLVIYTSVYVESLDCIEQGGPETIA